MTGIEVLILLAAGWLTAAPDQRTLQARGGILGAIGAAAASAWDRTRSEWAARPPRPPRPESEPGSEPGSESASGAPRSVRSVPARRPWRQTGAGRFLLALGRAGRRTWRAARAGGRVAVAGAAALPAGYQAGASRAVTNREARRARRARRAERKAGTPTTPTTPPLTTIIDGANAVDGVDATHGTATDPAPTVQPTTEPVVEPVEPVEPVESSGPVLERVERVGGMQVELEPDERAVQLPDGRVLRVRIDTGPPRTRFERLLSPQGLARHRQLVAIREAGYSGWLDQDLQAVPSAPDRWPASLERRDAAAPNSEGRDEHASGPSGPSVPGARPQPEAERAELERAELERAIARDDADEAAGMWPGDRDTCHTCRAWAGDEHLASDDHWRALGMHGWTHARREQQAARERVAARTGSAALQVLSEPSLGLAQEAPVDPAHDPAHDPSREALGAPAPVDPGSASAGPVTSSTTTTTTKESDVPEIAEFETTADLRAEAEELETMAEEIHAARAEFERRTKALEEKVGGAPFGTRAIAEAVTAIGEAATTDDAAEALVELRRALDESDALADVRDSLEAKGSVEAFTSA